MILTFMKKAPLYFCLVVLFLSGGFTYQQNVAELQLSFDARRQAIQVNYIPQGIVSNLLIHVNDSKGQTIFLENRYNVSGNYQCNVDIKDQPKGAYFVEVISDSKHINKQIDIK